MVADEAEYALEPLLLLLLLLLALLHPTYMVVALPIVRVTVLTALVATTPAMLADEAEE